MSKPKGTTLKYIVIGDSGVGKTNLLVRYCQDTFHTEYLSTIGVDFKIKRIQFLGNQVTLNIWDTAGQQRFKNITKSFYKGAHGILLTYSIIDPISYSHISNWIDQINQSGNANVKMVLVGTKSDMHRDRKVSIAQGEQLAKKYGMSFIETSAKTNENVNQVFQMLTSQILQNREPVTTLESSKIPLQAEPVKKQKQCCSS